MIAGCGSELVRAEASTLASDVLTAFPTLRLWEIGRQRNFRQRLSKSCFPEGWAPYGNRCTSPNGSRWHASLVLLIELSSVAVKVDPMVGYTCQTRLRI